MNLMPNIASRSLAMQRAAKRTAVQLRAKGVGLRRLTAFRHQQRSLVLAHAAKASTLAPAAEASVLAGNGTSRNGTGMLHQVTPPQYAVVPIQQQFKEIRQTVCREFLGGGLLYLEAGQLMMRNGYDVHHTFRPNSDFVYVTGGVGGRHGCAVLIDTATCETVLLVPQPREEMSYWVGRQPSLEQLAEMTGVDRVAYVEDLASILKSWRSSSSSAAGGPLELHTLPACATALRAAAPEGARITEDILPATLARCRATKTDAEVACLLRANQVSGLAHLDLWKAARPGLREAHLAAVFAATTRCGGLPQLGYPTIVGAGVNSAVMHYAAGEARLRSDDLVLVDAGAEYRCYTADITRCFPAGGRWTPAQADVYSAVLQVQKTALAAMAPGASFPDIDRKVRLELVGLLRDMGLIRRDAGSDEAALAAKVDRVFLPHGLGHFLGLDVHDVSDVGPVPKGLQPGHVVTVEPGLYFIPPLLAKAAADPKQAPFIDFDSATKLQSLGGVRIEDNVLITASGSFNLTEASGLPKELREVESLVGLQGPGAYSGPLAAADLFPDQDGHGMA